ncbi:hypothetical protein FSP39_014308 [Pinctada imbricata]|uniref:Protein kinase domain-containing protein n=1 Tax=Pinctada imbricata TaxID=66713 RepID=A0AA88YK56_PINIB|nr:hypothetical protein FSP39_014308 [Pinctada imbricata]
MESRHRRESYVNYGMETIAGLSFDSTGDIQEEIEEDDLDELFDKMDSLGIDASGLDDIEEFRERIRLHFETADSKESFFDKILQNLTDHSQDDTNKRKVLKTLLRSCQSSFKKFYKERISSSGREYSEGSKEIENLLITEGKTKDLNSDLTEKITKIDSNECIIVVSGETSAGKSSFLNLLIGERGLLPEHTLSCTSVITRLSYGEKPSVRVVKKDKSHDDIALKAGEPVGAQIDEILFHRKEEDRERGHDIQEVQLKVPIPLLKSGLVLVDSPGIGENEAMDAIIGEFVQTNHIMGFIYLIKSDQAGGVQEDRIGNLLKLIITTEKAKGELHGMGFDPKSAIFVCNLWDLIKQNEREVVYKNIVSRLSSYWPAITEQQVIPFSTKKARDELKINRKYVTTEYRNILCALEALFSASLDRRVHSTYRWMESILKRMTKHLKTLVNRIDTSEDDLALKLEKIRVKLTSLQDKSIRIFDDLKDNIAKTAENIHEQFLKYLALPQVRIRIVSWRIDEVPDPEQTTSWDEAKASIYQSTKARISKELAVWEKEKGIIQNLRDDLQKDIRLELSLLESEIEDISDDLESDSASSASPLGDDLSASQNPRHSTRRQTVTAANFAADLTSSMPIGFVARYLNPLGSAFGEIMSSSSNRLKEYQNKPCRVANEKSDRFLKYLLNTPQGNEVLKTFIENTLEGPKELLSGIEKRIPSIVNTNMELMDQILRSKRNTKESRSVYEEMMEGLESLKMELTEYGKGEIFVTDFKATAISICDSTDESGKRTMQVSDFIRGSSAESFREESRGLWTMMENGVLDNKRDILIRMYMVSAKVDHTYSEVSKLRFLKHENIADFLGIHNMGNAVPAFIYDDSATGRMKTLYQFFKYSKPVKDVVPEILEQTVKGIDYLHRRNLVHMELNIYTVTINGSGTVKLTGGCLPRRAALPSDRESLQISYFVYLSPDVLNGETYLACDDVYSLCLLIYELCVVRKPFLEQRKWSIDEFITRVNPYSMLGMQEFIKCFDPTLGKLIERGIDIRVDHRPRVDEFLKPLSTPFSFVSAADEVHYSQSRLRRSSSKNNS